MGAARRVLLRRVTGAITTLGHVLLPSAFGRQVTRLVGTVKHSGQREALSISVTITTRQRVTAARSDAQWSADTPALVAQQHLDTFAGQHAETRSLLGPRHATTATPSVGMDAVRIAQMLRPDGLAQLSLAVGLIAHKYAETVSRPLQKDAMTATRQRATAAAQYAQSSADTIAMDSRLCVPLRHAVTENVQALNHATMEPP